MYHQIEIEPIEEYRRRKEGNTNATNNNPYEYFKTESHYHKNTSSADHDYDIYFNSDGSVVWYRKKFNRVVYNDVLRGTYYLQENGRNRYDIFVRWQNGSRVTGYVTFQGTRPRIVLYSHVFWGN